MAKTTKKVSLFEMFVMVLVSKMEPNKLTALCLDVAELFGMNIAQGKMLAAVVKSAATIKTTLIEAGARAMDDDVFFGNLAVCFQQYFGALKGESAVSIAKAAGLVASYNKETGEITLKTQAEVEKEKAEIEAAKHAKK